MSLPPGPVYGVTIDDIANISSVVSAAEAMPYMSTTRVYLDPTEPASYYKSALQQLAPHTYVMGEILDSSDMKSMTVSAEQTRVSSLLSTLGSTVDVWEIGNEVNGNWTGSYSTGAQMLVNTYNQVAADGDRSALTLYENSWAPNNCGDGTSELTPQQYSSRYVPASVRDGIDYVLLSWYPTQCSGLSGNVPVSTITAEVQGLHTLYPNALIGFGELGLPNRTKSSTEAKAESIMAYYYGIAISEPYYIGGYFWWYWDEDLSLSGMPAALHNAFGAENAALGTNNDGGVSTTTTTTGTVHDDHDDDPGPDTTTTATTRLPPWHRRLPRRPPWPPRPPRRWHPRRPRRSLQLQPARARPRPSRPWAAPSGRTARPRTRGRISGTATARRKRPPTRHSTRMWLRWNPKCPRRRHRRTLRC